MPSNYRPSLFRGIAAVALCLLALAPAGCKKRGATGKGGSPSQTTTAGGGQPTDGAAATGHDIAFNPAAALDAGVPRSDLELYGVKLGDPAPAAGAGEKPDESGWVNYHGKENVFRVEDGKVVAMLLADDPALAKLNITNEQELQTRFGQTEKLEGGPSDPQVGYTFKDRDLTVWWDRKAGKVAAINIGM